MLSLLRTFINKALLSDTKLFRSFASHQDVLAAIPIINNCFGLKISAKSFTCDSPPGSAASSQEEPDSTDAVLLADSVTEAMLDISGTEV